MKPLPIRASSAHADRRPRAVAPTRLDREPLNPHSVLQLQRAIGNAAVGHALSVQRNSGAQEDVQPKMAEITRMFRAKELQSKNAVASPQEETETSRYGRDLALNGLCGGWVELFMRYPDWVEPVYNAVRHVGPPARRQ